MRFDLFIFTLFALTLAGIRAQKSYDYNFDPDESYDPGEPQDPTVRTFLKTIAMNILG